MDGGVNEVSWVNDSVHPAAAAASNSQLENGRFVGVARGRAACLGDLAAPGW